MEGLELLGGRRHEARLPREPAGCSKRGSHVAGGQGTVKSGEGTVKVRSGSTPSWRLGPGRARHVDAGHMGTGG